MSFDKEKQVEQTKLKTENYQNLFIQKMYSIHWRIYSVLTHRKMKQNLVRLDTECKYKTNKQNNSDEKS